MVDYVQKYTYHAKADEDGDGMVRSAAVPDSRGVKGQLTYTNRSQLAFLINR
jgi:hypothetical protein